MLESPPHPCSASHPRRSVTRILLARADLAVLGVTIGNLVFDGVGEVNGRSCGEATFRGESVLQTRSYVTVHLVLLDLFEHWEGEREAGNVVEERIEQGML